MYNNIFYKPLNLSVCQIRTNKSIWLYELYIIKKVNIRVGTDVFLSIYLVNNKIVVFCTFLFYVLKNNIVLYCTIVTMKHQHIIIILLYMEAHCIC